MNVLIIADDDGVKHQLPVSKVEVLISCGDLADDVILHAADLCSAKRVFAVKGNHDSNAPFPSPITDLHLQAVEFSGVLFGGFGGSWKYKPRGHHLFEQNEVDAALRQFPRVDVFVAHNSPRLVHDQDDEVHLGFVAFSDYISRHKPRFFLHGHQQVNKETQLERTHVIGTYGFRRITIDA